MLKYLKKMADDQSISPAGRCGYVTFDEMAIQVRRKFIVYIIWSQETVECVHLFCTNVPL